MLMQNTFKVIVLTSLGIAAIVAPAKAQTVSALDEDLYFNFNKDTQTKETLDKLKNIASLVSGCGSAQILNLTGHTDTTGNAEYNQSLSEKRAKKIKTLLVAMGVPKEIIRVSGMGERENLVDLGDNVKNELNRRVNAALQQDRSCILTQPVKLSQEPVENTQSVSQPTEVYRPYTPPNAAVEPFSGISRSAVGNSSYAPAASAAPPTGTTMSVPVTATPVGASVPPPVVNPSTGVAGAGVSIPAVAATAVAIAAGIAVASEDRTPDLPASP